ncbi:MAG: hypothetical protein LN575_04110 [Rickettsia endosymbiont of Gnoriste bilineata]|nr:hypothetical protein [Rickettsia endosymbiont of Gnoriste bilineata]
MFKLLLTIALTALHEHFITFTTAFQILLSLMALMGASNIFSTFFNCSVAKSFKRPVRVSEELNLCRSQDLILQTP